MLAGGALYLYNLDRVLERYFHAGETLVEQGEYTAALEIFQTIYERHPGFYLAPQALYQAGEILHLYQKAYPEAVLTYLLVEKDFPDSEEARQAQRQVAEIYKYRLRDYPEAIVAYQKLFDRGGDPGDRLQYEIADTYFRLNNFEQARIEFENLLKNWPQSSLVPEVRYRIAVAYALDGELKAAEEAFRGVIRDLPDNPFAVEARFGLAGVLEDEDQLVAALEVLEGLRGVYPKTEVLDQKIDQVRERIRKKQKAI
jgi:TolA-binding protein